MLWRSNKVRLAYPAYPRQRRLGQRSSERICRNEATRTAGDANEELRRMKVRGIWFRWVLAQEKPRQWDCASFREKE